MSCDCMKTMDVALAGRNTKLSPTLVFGSGKKTGYVTVTIDTEVIEKRRGARAVGVIPTFCPFCGAKYEVQS